MAKQEKKKVKIKDLPLTKKNSKKALESIVGGKRGPQKVDPATAPQK
jgi:hypothetical protein